MTRRTPTPSSLALRQFASSSTASAAPAPKPVTKPGACVDSAASTKNFVLADMDGRGSRENRACASCIAKLARREIGQVNWHISADQSCRLCQIAQGKPEAYTKPFCDFLCENPTVFHAVDYFTTKLSHLGYKELSPRDSWTGKLERGGKYWITRNGSSIIAFAVGKAYEPGNGLAIIGGHIDALTARLKPVSKKPSKEGYVELGVAPYSGGLNETWWDRDLSIGGRVLVCDEETGKTSSKLVKLDWPIAKIPTLAPHFGVGIMGSKNLETEAVPIIGLESSGDASAEALGPEGSFVSKQPPKLVKLIAKQLGLRNCSSIVNWELELFDSQPAQTLGMDKEFITAGRLDDKLCSWSALMGLLAASDRDDEGSIKMVCLFDNEEIGSKLRQGAAGNLLPSVVERTVEALCPGSFGPGLVGQTYARSFFVSADVTHAGNPNFLGSYLDEHTPRPNVGMVISADSNGHMTTDSVSTAIMQRCADLSGCRTQTFMIRNDSRSGGTIGPHVSTMLGVKACDVGLPQLSMHSVRATCGALDPGLGVQFFQGFLDNWEKVDAEWEH